MEITEGGRPNRDEDVLAENGQPPVPTDLITRLNLPEEVTTQQAAAILGCCKHTILAYLQHGLLEWRNAAPPSSNRPVYRLTLRSVLELRLGYQRGNPQPPRSAQPLKKRPRCSAPAGFTPKHLRRRKSSSPENDAAAGQ
jgi:hypothetical protein